MVLFRLLRHLRQYCGYCKTKVNVLNFFSFDLLLLRRAAFSGTKKRLFTGFQVMSGNHLKSLVTNRIAHTAEEPAIGENSTRLLRICRELLPFTMGCFICKMNYTGYLNICQEKSVIILHGF